MIDMKSSHNTDNGRASSTNSMPLGAEPDYDAEIDQFQKHHTDLISRLTNTLQTVRSTYDGRVLALRDREDEAAKGEIAQMRNAYRVAEERLRRARAMDPDRATAT